MITTAIPNSPSTTNEEGPRLVFAMAMHEKSRFELLSKGLFLEVFSREGNTLLAFS